MTATSAAHCKGIWLMGVSLAVLGAVAGLVAWRSSHAPRLDPVTLWAADRPVTGEVLVLLDVTDPLTPEQRGRLIEWLREFELTTLRPNERVSLWVLGSGAVGGLERRFCRCYPGRVMDPVLHNPARSAAVCDSLFTSPLHAAVMEAAEVSSSSSSPILEAIAELSRQPEVAEGSAPKRFVLVSDLEENTPRLSFYVGAPGFAGFRQSPHFPRVRADLHGVAVDVLYLPRGGDAASIAPDLPAFWREYFAACGASSVRMRRL